MPQKQNRQTFQRSSIYARLKLEKEPEKLQTQLRDLARELASEIFTSDSSCGKELLGTFVSELFLSIAEQERKEYRRQKQADGIAEAKARGVRFGPEPKPLPVNFDECYEAWQDGQMTATQAAETCGLSRKGFYRAVEKKKKMAGYAV